MLPAGCASASPPRAAASSSHATANSPHATSAAAAAIGPAAPVTPIKQCGDLGNKPAGAAVGINKRQRVGNANDYTAQSSDHVVTGEASGAGGGLATPATLESSALASAALAASSVAAIEPTTAEPTDAAVTTSSSGAAGMPRP